jgi:hypothetical protein
MAANDTKNRSGEAKGPANRHYAYKTLPVLYFSQIIEHHPSIITGH